MSGDDIEWLQDQFVKTVAERLKASKGDRKIAKENQGKVLRVPMLWQLANNHCSCRRSASVPHQRQDLELED